MFDKVEYRVGFGVGEDRHGRFIFSNERVAAEKAVERLAASLFGGFTTRFVRGGWINPDDRLVTEDGEEISVLVPEHAGTEARIVDFAGQVGRIFNQHSVVVIRPDGRAAILPIDYDTDGDRRCPGCGQLGQALNPTHQCPADF